MAKIDIELSEEEVKQMISDHLENMLGNVNFDSDNVIIETKSKQNYRSEWETASFRVKYSTIKSR